MAHHLADPWLVRLLAQPGRPLEAHLQQPERLVVPCCPQVQWPERLLVARRQHLEVLLLGVHVVALVVGLVDHVVGPVEVVQVDLVVVLEVKVRVVDQVEAHTIAAAKPLVVLLRRGSMALQDPSIPPRTRQA